MLVAIVAAVYALARRPTWQASQALILRNEAANGETRRASSTAPTK